MSAHAALTGELVKTTNGLPLQGPGLNLQTIKFQTLASGVVMVLALALAPLAEAQPQRDAQAAQSTQQPSQPGQTARPAPSPDDDDNAPVPPMPPDPAGSAAPSATEQLAADHSAADHSPDDFLPDSPGTVQSAQLEAQQTAAMPQSTQSQPAAQPAAQPAVPPLPKELLGTAAAETVPTMGVAASRPAGAALAPGKQRRIRSFLIRTGAIVGAAAAVGVTMALTEGSPSKPPGAH